MKPFGRHLIGILFLAIAILGIYSSAPTKKYNGSTNSASAIVRFTPIGDMNVNSTTNQISNWSGRFQFDSEYGYDFDLQKQIVPATSCDCIVVVDVNKDGTGKLVYSVADNDKTTIEINSSYLNKSNNLITLNATNSYYGTPIIFSFETDGNNQIKRFWFRDAKAGRGLVFY